MSQDFSGEIEMDYCKKRFTHLVVFIGRISPHQRKKFMQLVILVQITKSAPIIEKRVRSTPKKVLHE